MKNPTKPEYTPLAQVHVDELIRIVGNANVIFDDPERLQAFSHDEAAHCETVLPEALVRPASAEEISAILRFANQHHIAVTARGAGSGLSGGAVPLYRGLVLDCSRMSRILEIDRQNLTITVEPGVITAEINEMLRPYNLFYAG
ncbi:MAG: FAD-binding oxidoreductase, partial [Lentisphaeria bacterium]